jgi:hypothetical protein
MSTAFTSVVQSKNVPGNRYMSQVTLTGPTSYTTGGIAYTPSTFGFDYNADAVIISSVSGGLIAIWDRANKKIKLFYPTGGASAPATVTAPVAAAPALSGAPAIGTLAVSGAPAIGTLAAAAPGIGTHAGTVTPDAGATTMTGSAAKPTLSVTFSGALAAPALSGAPAIGTLAVAGAPAIGTLASAAPALTGGQGIEVAASTDVSAIVIECLAFGF